MVSATFVCLNEGQLYSHWNSWVVFEEKTLSAECCFCQEANSLCLYLNAMRSPNRVVATAAGFTVSALRIIEG